MGARKITAEQVEEACTLREQGKSFAQIVRHFAAHGLAISEGAISWHCLVNGADLPKSRRQASRGTPGSIARRGDHVVRMFTPEEDSLLIELEGQGVGNSAIGRRLNRRPNSIRGRLATLARRDERALGE